MVGFGMCGLLCPIPYSASNTELGKKSSFHITHSRSCRDSSVKSTNSLVYMPIQKVKDAFWGVRAHTESFKVHAYLPRIWSPRTLGLVCECTCKALFHVQLKHMKGMIAMLSLSQTHTCNCAAQGGCTLVENKWPEKGAQCKE
eukprot:1149922-Pelagomonas_calceolata.AAC.4